MPLERRRPDHVRVPLRISALLFEEATPSRRPTPGETRDISRGGARLRVEGATRPSTPVEVILRLVHRPPLSLRGTVVWSAGPPDPSRRELGIQFREEIPPGLVAEIAHAGCRGSPGPAE